MNINNSFNDSFNELVFEKRNKEYGAYVLRTSHSANVSRALLYTTALFLALIFTTWMLNRKDEAPVIEFHPLPPVLGGVLIDVTPHVTPKTPPSAGPRSNNAPPMVVDKPQPKTDPLPDPGPDQLLHGTGGPKGTDTAAAGPPPIVIPINPPAPTVVRVPDVMPELKDLYDRIRKTLHYPQMAVEEHIEGTVYLSFIVETDGSISSIEALKKVPAGCTEEAIRVISGLPKWTPGMKDGKPVRVPCTLPVKFVLK